MSKIQKLYYSLFAAFSGIYKTVNHPISLYYIRSYIVLLGLITIYIIGIVIALYFIQIKQIDFRPKTI